ncbi:MAG: hypothetical protein CL666_11750 [Balneola sp.]|nr:hypothetical protein [Balneola sp.]
MHSLHNIASYILNKYPGEITPMKLQKLLYYVKVWTLVADKKMIKSSDAFFAWKHGPVNPSIYHQYKGYKNNPIEDTPSYLPFTDDEKEVVDFVLDSYGFYNAITLSKATHAEDPWINKKEVSGRITDQDILDYYTHESFAKNFPLNKTHGYYPPNTISHYAFVFDMDKTDKAAEVMFDSIEEYKNLFSKASEDYKFLVNQIY